MQQEKQLELVADNRDKVISDAVIKEQYDLAIEGRDEVLEAIDRKNLEIALALEALEELDDELEMYASFIQLYDTIHLPDKKKEAIPTPAETVDKAEGIGYSFEMKRQVVHGGYIDAKMIRSKDDNHYVLRKGSRIANNVTEYLNKGAKEARKNYGVYINKDFVTQRDIVFQSVSQITAFVMGRSGESYTVWNEVTTGLSLDNYMPKEWQEKRR